MSSSTPQISFPAFEESSKDDHAKLTTSHKKNKKTKKRKAVSEMSAAGVFKVGTAGSSNLRIVALDTVSDSQFLNSKTDFREELLLETTKKARQRSKF
jgi:hypothetical protein